MTLITLPFVVVRILDTATVAIRDQRLPGTANPVFRIVLALIAGDARSMHISCEQFPTIPL